MTAIQLLFFIFSLFIISCSKAKNDSVQKIDVSKQWITDPVGQVILGIEDGQWQKKTFTSAELYLFKSLDTADLSGTNKPDSVMESPLRYNCIFPNPFSSQTHLQFNFTDGFSGQISFKFVIVDSLMNPLAKGAIKIPPTVCSICPTHPSTLAIGILPNLPPGRFRLYFTLSSQTHKDFYSCWGNIQHN